MKFLRVSPSFGLVKKEVSIGIEITQCPHKCKGCHSPELCEDIGSELTKDALANILNHYTHENCPLFSCVVFMGGDHDPFALVKRIREVKSQYPDIKIGLYSGAEKVSEEIESLLDYLKTGKYVEELGSLDSPTTNQKFIEFER